MTKTPTSSQKPIGKRRPSEKRILQVAKAMDAMLAPHAAKAIAALPQSALESIKPNLRRIVCKRQVTPQELWTSQLAQLGIRTPFANNLHECLLRLLGAVEAVTTGATVQVRDYTVPPSEQKWKTVEAREFLTPSVITNCITGKLMFRTVFAER